MKAGPDGTGAPVPDGTAVPDGTTGVVASPDGSTGPGPGAVGWMMVELT